MSAGALADAVATAEVVVCCGSGGVGKTTTAATIGLQAARLGRRAAVITIDPAKRLADAFGLPGGLGNDPARIPLHAPGELWAAMLDTAATFDALVQANASSPEQAQRILGNRFYRNVSRSFGGTQDYMAAERLHSLHADERFDLVVVDTPPSRDALDFLDAPGTISRFLDHPLMRIVMVPARRGLRVLNVAAQPVLRTIGKVVGGEVLADALAFFQAFQGMEAGFRRRAEQVQALLRADVTRYVLVASPRPDTLDEAAYFAGRIRESKLAVSAVVVNRSTPRFAPPPSPRPATAPHAELHDNLAELVAMAAAEEHLVGEVLGDVSEPADASWVPLLPTDVHDLDGLAVLCGLLFDGDEPSR